MSAIRDYLNTLNEEYILLEPEAFDVAIVGLTERAVGVAAVGYSTAKVLEVLMRDGMSQEDAEEFFGFNIIGAYMGENSPVFLTTLAELPLAD